MASRIKPRKRPWQVGTTLDERELHLLQMIVDETGISEAEALRRGLTVYAIELELIGHEKPFPAGAGRRRRAG